MRAAYYESKGGPSVLRVGEVADVAPGPGEVRVRIAASAVNPSDTKAREGWGGASDMPFARVVPHNDGAGTIEAVGPGVPETRIGERVWVFEAQRDGRAFGTAAAFCTVPSRNAVTLPEGVSFEAGASLGVPGMTAHRLVFGGGGVQGRTVLVQGGAGSVGHLAVQLARWGGARVLATVGSDEQAAVARDCGAAFVANYKTDDVPARVADWLGAAGAVDLVVDVAFLANLDANVALLRPNGAIATYSISADADETTQDRPMLWPLVMKGLTVTLNTTLLYDDDIDVQISDFDAVGGLERNADGTVRLGKRPTFIQQLLVKYAVVF